ncbi:MAG: hypothetical protein GX345_04210 [Clostridiales bacterium]|nr:hypothetical protein [Clostridiales bacterium]
MSQNNFNDITFNQKPNKPSHNDRKFKPFKKAITVLLAFIAVVAITSVTVLAYVVGNIYSFANGEAKIVLEEYMRGQSRTSFVYATDKEGKEVLIEKLHGEENRVWANLEEMSPYISKAFVALEDKRFEDHKGVDWIRFVGVMTKYNFEQGASTITQQLIKNLTGENDVTVVRKFSEILSALNLERHYSKDLILETYLNTVALGNGCYGVRTASEKYFGKDVNELNIAESACLAAITQAPYTKDPLYHFENNRERQKICLKYMLEQEMISKSEYEEALNHKVLLTNSPDYIPKKDDKSKVDKEQKFQSFYIDFIIQNVIDDLVEKHDLTVQEATRKIYYGGLKIYAAIDLDVQKALEDVYVNRVTFPKQTDTKERPAVQSAMTVMDYEGRVLGIIGQAGEKTGNRVLNRAANSPRQPGSSIKPLATYAPAIERNLVTWSSLILDKAFPYQGKTQWPKNVDNSYGSGSRVTVQRALEKSHNTVAARLCVDYVTPSKAFDFLKENFHISTLDPKGDPFAAPMALGALTKGVTTLDMAAAYAAFGNGGLYYKPYSYYKVTNNDGSEVLLENKPSGEQVIAPDTADVMCSMLQTVPIGAYGKAANARRFQIMCKTGTTDKEHDRWFCGGSPHFVAAVWYGYDLPRKINQSPNPAGMIFFEVFDRISKGMPDKTFSRSDLAVEKNYCLNSGLLASANCQSTAKGWYRIGNLPSTCTSCSAPAQKLPDGVDDLIDGVLDGIAGVVDEIAGQFTKPAVRNDD